MTANRRVSNLSYDAARSGNDHDSHWSFADSNDADSANNRQVRQTLVKRSRYEQGSNGYYAGILATHTNMIVGKGPTLRMLTQNREFNQLVEREFYQWTLDIGLRRKLWAMCHARVQDGETFAILQTNPRAKNRVQLDVTPIETEQCQTPWGEVADRGRVDGIWFDEFNNVLAYDILLEHPGSNAISVAQEAITVPASQVIHWFKLKRPGAHRGIPDMTPTLNLGASRRRHCEATVAAAETAADIAAMLTSTLPSGSDSEPDPVDPFSSIQFTKRMLMVAPMGWDAKQMKGEHPNAQYNDFHRSLISEQARPISMPFNAAACDSSTYSFASGKLDTLCYRAELDVERCDCNETTLDRIFAAWFAEWTIVADRRDIPPAHQWDWPLHPVIDAVAESNATDTKLKNGSTSLRQVYSDAGKDFEDELSVMAEDFFGEATQENIDKARQILVLKNCPQATLPFVAQILGLATAPTNSTAPNAPGVQADEPIPTPA